MVENLVQNGTWLSLSFALAALLYSPGVAAGRAA